MADCSPRHRREGNAGTTILYLLRICRRPHSSSVMTAGRRDAGWTRLHGVACRLAASAALCARGSREGARGDLRKGGDPERERLRQLRSHTQGGGRLLSSSARGGSEARVGFVPCGAPRQRARSGCALGRRRARTSTRSPFDHWSFDHSPFDRWSDGRAPRCARPRWRRCRRRLPRSRCRPWCSSPTPSCTRRRSLRGT